jgi:hypothetical protein
MICTILEKDVPSSIPALLLSMHYFCFDQGSLASEDLVVAHVQNTYISFGSSKHEEVMNGLRVPNLVSATTYPFHDNAGATRRMPLLFGTSAMWLFKQVAFFIAN